MSERTDPRVEITVSLALVVICGLVLVEARSIPPGFFEPLGSAPVPRFVAWAIIGLCLVVIARAAWRLRAGFAQPAEPPSRWLDLLAIAVLTGAYVLVLQWRLTTFGVMTTAYLVLAIGLLVRFDRRRLPWVALVAAITGFGSQYVFTRIFVVDLPGL